MPLYIRDDDVDALAGRLQRIAGTRTKTEAVRQALTHELERAESEPTLVEKALAMTRELNRKYAPTGLKADKAFIDSLYED